MRLETEPDFFFDFFLAEKLNLSLDAVRAMPAEDWLAWGVYFGRKQQQQELARLRGKG